jgi:hypothetical protein
VRFCPVAEETAALQDFESAYVRIGSMNGPKATSR